VDDIHNVDRQENQTTFLLGSACAQRHASTFVDSFCCQKSTDSNRGLFAYEESNVQSISQECMQVELDNNEVYTCSVC